MKSLFVTIVFAAGAAGAAPTALCPDGKLVVPAGASVHLRPPGGLGGDWRVNGEVRPPPELGTLVVDRDFFGAVYTAPRSAPDRGEIAISAGATVGHGALILVCNVTVIDAPNWFALDGDDDRSIWVVNEAAPMQRTTNELVVMTEGDVTIQVSGLDRKQTTTSLTMALTLAGSDQPGTHPWKITWNEKEGMKHPSTTVAVRHASMTGGSPSLLYASFDCTPHGASDCTGVSLEGATTVSSSGGGGKAMTGTFAGTLVGTDASGAVHSVKVRGAFSVVRR